MKLMIFWTNTFFLLSWDIFLRNLELIEDVFFFHHPVANLSVSSSWMKLDVLVIFLFILKKKNYSARFFQLALPRSVQQYIKLEVWQFEFLTVEIFWLVRWLTVKRASLLPIYHFHCINNVTFATLSYEFFCTLLSAHQFLRSVFYTKWTTEKKTAIFE